MENTYKYFEKEPRNCCEYQLNKFYDLVLKGNKVQKEGLKRRISNCKLLGFCSINENIIAISSIKRPQKSYIETVINNAKLDRNWTELEFEIGYSYTENDYREKGISTEIKRRLLERMKEIKGKIFSTTAITSSQRFLIQNGFINYGKAYDGKNDKNIKYFERN